MNSSERSRFDYKYSGSRGIHNWCLIHIESDGIFQGRGNCMRKRPHIDKNGQNDSTLEGCGNSGSVQTDPSSEVAVEKICKEEAKLIRISPLVPLKVS